MPSSNDRAPSAQKKTVQLPTMEEILHGPAPNNSDTQQSKPAPVPEGAVALPGFDYMTGYSRKKKKQEKEEAARRAAVEQAIIEAEEQKKNAAAGDAQQVLEGEAPEPAPERPQEIERILSQEREALLQEIEQERARILAEAEREKNRILDEATLEALNMRDHIREEEEQKAKQESREQIAEVVDTLRRAIREFQKEKEQLFEFLEQRLMVTAISVMDLVFREEIQYNKAAYAAIIKAALNELGSDHASKMVTSPDAYDIIMHEPACAPILERLNELGMEIVRDVTVPVGDVQVRSAQSTMQYGTATMVKRMTERVVEQLER